MAQPNSKNNGTSKIRNLLCKVKTLNELVATNLIIGAEERSASVCDSIESPPSSAYPDRSAIASAIAL